MSDKLNVMELGNPKGLYGAERWILALVRYLDRQKITTWVATIRDEPELPAPLCLESDKLGCLTHIFECSGKYNVEAVTSVRQFILNNKIDILHTHGYKTDLIGLLAVRGTSCKIISTPHGWTQKPDIKLWCYELLDRLIFPFFDVVVPLSDALYDNLCRIPLMKNKLQLIINGVDISEIKEVTETASEIGEWKKQGAFIIGYIGRLTPGKGLDVLFQALARSGQPNWRVAIIGEGEQQEELQSLVQALGVGSQVTFLGYRTDRISFLNGFDVFVLPSRSEGIPRCIMEAMAAGIPVIATDIPGCRHLIEHQKTGLLFAVDQAEEFVQAIKQIADDPVLKDNIRDNAYEYINTTYSAARMAKEYEELFFRLAAPVDAGSINVKKMIGG